MQLGVQRTPGTHFDFTPSAIVRLGSSRADRRCGYPQNATRTAVNEDWVNELRDWVLLTKDL